MISGDLLLIYDAAGRTQTFTLPGLKSPVSCVSFHLTDPNVLFIGYESGELVILRLDEEEPFIHQFHGTALRQIYQVGRSLWVLHEGSVVVQIVNIDLIMTTEALQYSVIRKFRLTGNVKCIAPCGTNGLIAVGSDPMIQQLNDLSSLDTDIIADELDAMRIRAKQTASQVKSALRGLWSRNASKEELGGVVPVVVSSRLADKRSIKVTPDVFMDEEEEDRTFQLVSITPDGSYAMVIDSFNGRLMLYHVRAGLFTRLWKGYRGAQCIFLPEEGQRLAMISAPKQHFIELRDIQKDERLAKLDLSEAMSAKEIKLLSSSLFASCTSVGLEVFKLSHNKI